MMTVINVNENPEPNVGKPDVLMSIQVRDAADLLPCFFGVHDNGKHRLEIGALS